MFIYEIHPFKGTMVIRIVQMNETRIVRALATLSKEKQLKSQDFVTKDNTWKLK